MQLEKVDKFLTSTPSFSQFWIKGCKWLSMSRLKKGSVPETFSSYIGHSNKAQSLSFQISLYTRTLEGWKVLSSLLQTCWHREAEVDWTEIQMWWLPRWEKSRFLPLPALLPATWGQKHPGERTAMTHISEDAPQARSYPVILEI